MHRLFSLNRVGRLRTVWIAFAIAVSPLALHAFPPAPFYTLYGMVRDENGQTLRVEGAVVVFYKNGAEVMRQTIAESEARLDQNYQFRLRMDMQRSGTRSYSSLANSPGSTFSLVILIHDIPYYPIELSGPIAPTIGSPGERIRLDLTLGIDSDGDGIPDAWEQSQLYAGGIMPGPDGWDLSLLDRTGDFDGDGLDNQSEYIAGTFATDNTDFLALEIKEKLPTSVRLQFFSIYGKVYSVESSSNLVTWTPVSLYLRNPDSTDSDDIANPPVPQASLLADVTNIVDIYADGNSPTRTFYRLKVR